ncbi:MAG: DUF4249 domain-containing protein [Bacteroidota bacterium]|nr:DUF4249 domain-containing protein [Bacteroidota bacterium]MDP4246131.1 DUF4249 domain-containing protein [Bacteroidota bacterium]MDP4252444.1 DUF4249 domain-containing protein [Bacteroidota bacterium]MDP4256628.1 DUF4249 domain-containing protein [Bacteroidota bacterium]
MKRDKIIGLLLGSMIMIGLFHCREVYVSPYVPPAAGYLVVEGYISGNAPVSFTLSRVARLSADSTMLPERGAQVQIEGNDNSAYPLTGQGKGVYSSSGMLPLNASVQYRIRITTGSGGKYLSDYVPYKVTPAIDSINWAETTEGVTIFANAHDHTSSTRYYLWSYDEEWEYHSAEQSLYYYDASFNQVLARDTSQLIYRCWHGGPSTNILAFSTEKLAQDVVYEYPVRFIPINSVVLSQTYSILVRQYAITRDGYEFFSLMRQNTEQQGTIFDAQPSQLSGNIHSLSNPGEIVVGFISAGSLVQQRIFISNAQLPEWRYLYLCPAPDTSFNSPSQFPLVYGTSYTPIDLNPRGFISNYTSCIDCRTQGGTTTRPSYWPN